MMSLLYMAVLVLSSSESNLVTHFLDDAVILFDDL
jgi:hypothetical protein